MVQFRDGDSEAENQAPALLRLHARRRRAGTPCAERFPQSAGPLSAHRAPYWAQGCPDAHFTDEETGSGTGRDLPGTTISFTSCGVPPRVIIITLGAWLGPAEFGDGLQPAGGVALRCLPPSPLRPRFPHRAWGGLHETRQAKGVTLGCSARNDDGVGCSNGDVLVHSTQSAWAPRNQDNSQRSGCAPSSCHSGGARDGCCRQQGAPLPHQSAGSLPTGLQPPDPAGRRGAWGPGSGAQVPSQPPQPPQPSRLSPLPGRGFRHLSPVRPSQGRSLGGCWAWGCVQRCCQHPRSLCRCPGAAVTNCHKLGGCKDCRSPKSTSAQDLALPAGSRGGSFLPPPGVPQL